MSTSINDAINNATETTTNQITPTAKGTPAPAHVYDSIIDFDVAMRKAILKTAKEWRPNFHDLGMGLQIEQIISEVEQSRIDIPKMMREVKRKEKEGQQRNTPLRQPIHISVALNQLNSMMNVLRTNYNTAGHSSDNQESNQ